MPQKRYIFEVNTSLELLSSGYMVLRPSNAALPALSVTPGLNPI